METSQEYIDWAKARNTIESLEREIEEKREKIANQIKHLRKIVYHPLSNRAKKAILGSARKESPWNVRAIMALNFLYCETEFRNMAYQTYLDYKASSHVEAAQIWYHAAISPIAAMWYPVYK
jgi:hypothetical protein